ncbi:hypothetical protein [Nannocystis pusilla]|uniref:hypothetical protein n=1 Tax=Nannocystis pusilla TaxID=889268 RepID=UPI003B7C0CED
MMLHPRCTNCHPAGDSPLQGDTAQLHDPPVVRGPANEGVPGLLCTSCHQDANLELARVPGRPSGTWRRSRWRGSGSRRRRCASRSRIPSATAARRWRRSSSTRRTTSWSRGLGARPRAHAGPGTQAHLGR